jgi:hypothetical protein
MRRSRPAFARISRGFWGIGKTLGELNRADFGSKEVATPSHDEGPQAMRRAQILPIYNTEK